MNQQDSLININVAIAERIYPLRIKTEEEETIRSAARMINEKIKEYHNHYAAKDKQDFLAMLALTLAVEVKQGGGISLHESDFSLHEKLQELHTVLSESTLF